MKLGHTNDEIKFHEATPEAAFYMVILDGEPTMKIMCVHGDPESVIRIGRANGTGYQETAGRFTTVTELIEDADGAPAGVGEARVDEKSVYTYVIPRLHVLLGRLLRAA